MTFSINTHDAWGIVRVGCFASLEEAREAFATLCQDPWYQQDGGVKGLELVDDGDGDGDSNKNENGIGNGHGGDWGRGSACGISADMNSGTGMNGGTGMNSGARRLAWFSLRA
jgi:hypothetical protein